MERPLGATTATITHREPTAEAYDAAHKRAPSCDGAVEANTSKQLTRPNTMISDAMKLKKKVVSGLTSSNALNATVDIDHSRPLGDLEPVCGASRGRSGEEELPHSFSVCRSLYENTSQDAPSVPLIVDELALRSGRA